MSVGGTAVLAGRAEVRTQAGEVRTPEFVRGAHHALDLARQHAVRIAVLKENSPSCGSAHIYDGSHSGRRVPGEGVTAALLRQHGLRVFSDLQLEDADLYLRSLEATR